MTVSMAAAKIYGESTPRTQRKVQRLIQRKAFPGVRPLDPTAKRPTYLIPEAEVDTFIAAEKKRDQSVED
jgi:hypothetical protein